MGVNVLRKGCLRTPVTLVQYEIPDELDKDIDHYRIDEEKTKGEAVIALLEAGLRAENSRSEVSSWEDDADGGAEA
jgi:hypothetical protein